LRQDYAEFVRRDAEILVVGPEDLKAFERYWQKEQFPFVGLADPTHEVARLYGQQIKVLKMGRLPALMVIGKNGQVAYEHFGESMSDIHANSAVLAVLDKLNQPA
jgi:peroxiredoxin